MFQHLSCVITCPVRAEILNCTPEGRGRIALFSFTALIKQNPTHSWMYKKLHLPKALGVIWISTLQYMMHLWPFSSWPSALGACSAMYTQGCVVTGPHSSAPACGPDVKSNDWQYLMQEILKYAVPVVFLCRSGELCYLFFQSCLFLALPTPRWALWPSVWHTAACSR